MEYVRAHHERPFWTGRGRRYAFPALVVVHSAAILGLLILLFAM